jgi:uncharacterized OsmC-like protein
MTPATQPITNGINLAPVETLLAGIEADSGQAKARFGAATHWRGGLRSETHITAWHLGGRRMEKNCRLAIDEPLELGGTNTALNPQEALFAAFNSCVLATYAALCTLKGIEVRELRVESEGELDLRGFLALDEETPSGYREVSCRVYLKADAPEETLRSIHEAVKKQSPNFFNLTRPVRLHDTLVLG